MEAVLAAVGAGAPPVTVRQTRKLTERAVRRAIRGRFANLEESWRREALLQSGRPLTSRQATSASSLQIDGPSHYRPHTARERMSKTEGAKESVVIGAEHVARALAAPASAWLSEWGTYTSVELRGAVVAQRSIEGFVPADTFQGAKPGLVFKMGIAGIGYYPDKEAAANGVSSDNPAFDMDD